MSRKYPESPMVGVGAVVFWGNSAILVRRNNEPGKGRWSLPGGLVELGESLEEALKREIREELSVDVAIKGLLDVFERVVRDAQGRVVYHYVVVDYWAEVVSGSPAAGSDAGDMMLVCGEMAAACRISSEVKSMLDKAVRLRKGRL
ncbi:MAG TPA: NUDIX domain-containing protein [Desulfobacteraceae bacterium]|nr:NUDIX domain-containing protein [Desulfobacteraceae bacterium]